MSSKTTTYYKDSNGRSLETTTTRWDTGGSKTVTREQGGIFGGGRIVSVTERK